MKPKLLVINGIDNRQGLDEKLGCQFKIAYQPNFKTGDLSMIDNDVSAIFTKPNHLRVYFGQQVLGKFKFLKTLATASTGASHIDTQYVIKDVGF